MATITATEETIMTRKQIKIRAEIVQNLAIHALRKDDDATIGTVYSALVFKHGVEEMTKAEMPTIAEYRATVEEVRTNLLPA